MAELPKYIVLQISDVFITEDGEQQVQISDVTDKVNVLDADKSLTLKGRGITMATDYISREEAIKTVVNYKRNYCPKNMRDWATKLKRAFCSDICSDLAKLPAADVLENVTGTWTRIDYEPVGHDYICSVCQEMHDEASYFCPNCGAEMRTEVP